MAKLNFKNEGLKRLLQRLENAKSFYNNFSEAVLQYEKETGKKYDFTGDLDNKYYTTTAPGFHLVKDDGIYLMANSIPKEIDTKGMSHIVYAVGYDPRQGDVWEKCRDAVGGDDFVEQFDIDAQMKKLIEEGADMVINITATKFEIKLVKLTKK